MIKTKLWDVLLLLNSYFFKVQAAVNIVIIFLVYLRQLGPRIVNLVSGSH